jgi:uncharacterized protein
MIICDYNRKLLYLHKIFVMINRSLYNILNDNLSNNKALFVMGARQVGKSSLLEMISENLDPESVLWLNCDNIDERKILTNAKITDLKRISGNKKYVFIDEAQRVLNIGMSLKLITDQMKNIKLIVTGSSSFELSNLINEPLTGRKYEYKLFPLSVKECVNHFGFLEEKRQFENRLIFGSYPEVITNQGNEREILNNLVSSYLYKDIFIFQDLRKPELIEQLLEMLALQMGSEISYNELANSLMVDSGTVQKYINLLEKSFVIFRLRSFSRNVRNEIKKSRKIYFYDNGVRNTILENFNHINLRTDKGALFENYFIAERQKYLHYNNIYAKSYFWRTSQQQEIDYIEEIDGKLRSFEIKYNANKKVKMPLTFSRNYPDSDFYIVNSENFYDYLGM